jgi:hypothetical protein
MRRDDLLSALNALPFMCMVVLIAGMAWACTLFGAPYPTQPIATGSPVPMPEATGLWGLTATQWTAIGTGIGTVIAVVGSRKWTSKK